MLRNHFLATLRNLSRNTRFALVNILGLAVGIAVCLLVFTLIYFEWSTDRFHSNYDRVVRAYTWWEDTPAGVGNKGVSLPFKEAFQAYYGEELKMSALGEVWGQVDITGTDKHFKAESGFVAVEPDFIKLFDFSWVNGNPGEALRKPGSVLLSQGTAEKYFGSWKEAVGQHIQCMDGRMFTVAGIFEDPPVNTDFPFKALFSYADYFAGKPEGEKGWNSTNSNDQCYLLLPKGKTLADVNALMPGFINTLAGARDKYSENDRYSWQSLGEMHYNPYLSGLYGHTVSKNTLLGISLIGVFLLLLACINYINLATAQAFTRSREVGVRKALGGTPAALRRRFLTESFVITLCAVGLGWGLAGLLMPLAASISERPLDFSVAGWLRTAVFLACTLLTVSLLAGFYPSWALSRFNVVEALKSKVGKSPQSAIGLRRSLVVFQFVIAQVFLICVLVVVSQLGYFNKMDMGFDKETSVLLQVPADSLHTRKAFKETLLHTPGIAGTAYSNVAPSSEGSWTSSIFLDGKKISEPNPNIFYTDDAFLSVYEIPLVAGRNIQPADTMKEVVVNQAFLKAAGFGNAYDILGKTITIYEGLAMPVVGVVKNFHSHSFREKVPPLVMTSDLEAARLLNIKIAGGELPKGIEALEQTWKTFFPGKILEYEFLDKKIEAFYTQERRLADVIKICAGIAIFISCLGLYGLILFISAQRTKEMGVRRVLGATVGQICLLFGKDFVKLVGIAFFIATPLAWYAMHRWLQGFAYRIELEWWMFALAGLLATTIALLTVSFQSVRAALANPVKSLRSD